MAGNLNVQQSFIGWRGFAILTQTQRGREKKKVGKKTNPSRGEKRLVSNWGEVTPKY